MSKFVKTEVKTTILKTIDAVGPEVSYVSIVPMSCVKGVEVVVELISILQEVHDAMEDGK